jgi:hypothetical protein
VALKSRVKSCHTRNICDWKANCRESLKRVLLICFKYHAIGTLGGSKPQIMQRNLYPSIPPVGPMLYNAGNKASNLMIHRRNTSLNIERLVRFEGFTAVTMKNGVFWDVTPCGSYKNRCFGGT